MSDSHRAAHAFYREVARSGRVWVLQHVEHHQLPILAVHGHEVTPVWSSETRLKKVRPRLGPRLQIEHRPKEVAWEGFRDVLVPGLDAEGVLLGLNWSGQKAVGYDLAGASVVQAVEAARERPGRRAWWR